MELASQEECSDLAQPNYNAEKFSPDHLCLKWEMFLCVHDVRNLLKRETFIASTKLHPSGDRVEKF